MRTLNLTSRPLAAKGLVSYGCEGIYGWIMIGATDHDDLKQARRSNSSAKAEDLQVWNGTVYVPAHPTVH